MLLVSTTRIIPGRAVPSFLSGRYPAVKVRKKLYVTAYFEPYRASQGDAFVNEMMAYLSGGMLVAVVAGIVVCALVGAAIGTKVLRKHFERAGIA